MSLLMASVIKYQYLYNFAYITDVYFSAVNFNSYRVFHVRVRICSGCDHTFMGIKRGQYKDKSPMNAPNMSYPCTDDTQFEAKLILNNTETCALE